MLLFIHGSSKKGRAIPDEQRTVGSTAIYICEHSRNESIGNGCLHSMAIDTVQLETLLYKNGWLSVCHRKILLLPESTIKQQIRGTRSLNYKSLTLFRFHEHLAASSMRLKSRNYIVNKHSIENGHSLKIESIIRRRG